MSSEGNSYSFDDWKWKDKTKEIKDKKLNCFIEIFNSLNKLSYENRMAIREWMLLEMLLEIPKQKSKDNEWYYSQTKKTAYY